MYIYLYISRHLTNDKSLFLKDFCPKILNFTIIGNKIFFIKNIGNITLPLVNKFSIKLEGVTYALKYKFDLVLLG